MVKLTNTIANHYRIILDMKKICDIMFFSKDKEVILASYDTVKKVQEVKNH